MIPLAEETPLVPLWPGGRDLLGLKRSATYTAASRGEIPTLKIGAQTYIVVAELRAMLGLNGHGPPDAERGPVTALAQPAAAKPQVEDEGTTDVNGSDLSGRGA